MVKKSKKYNDRVLIFSGVYWLPVHVQIVFCRRILRISLLKPLIGRPNRMH